MKIKSKITNSRIKNIVTSEKGQLLPFIAVVLLLLILFTAFQFGLATAYLARIKVRDALDSAVLSAASIAEIKEKPTYYGERKKRVSDDPPEYEWRKTTSDYVKYITLSNAAARDIAEEYFIKNLQLARLKNWRLISLDIGVTEEQNMLQVHKHRPHTEGVITSWEENFPRWVAVDAVALVEVPVPLGGVFGREKMIVKVSAQAKKNIQLVNVGGGTWN